MAQGRQHSATSLACRRVDAWYVRILHQPHNVSFRRLLQREECFGLPPKRLARQRPGYFLHLHSGGSRHIDAHVHDTQPHT